MAKRASGKTKGRNGESTRHASTGFDADHAKSYVERIESIQAEIDEIMREAREKCTPHREDMKSTFKEAAEAGIPKTPLAAAVRKRRFETKAEGVRDKLNEQQADTFDQILHALGGLAELPLGRAAISEAAQESRAAAAPEKTLN